MGIPSFYRWLVERYPLAVSDVIEAPPYVINGVKIPIDTSLPNPNGVEFDNLYLDMNGIIHPCFHPEGQQAPKSYEEVFKNVFRYIDRIFSIIRPRKLLYMAIDGVAPRAKMNQQRSRRFKAAKEAAASVAGGDRLGNVLESESAKELDSNVITPGTEFMASLSSALQYYVHLRMNTDPGWRGIKVILSDANVAGEGEHKIMSYIRLQRNLPGFDPNTRHCLYGLDADLIMLSLATHEIHFSILREEFNNMRRNTKSSEIGNGFMPGGRLDGNQELKSGKVGIEDYITRQKFQFFNVWVLRDYLAHAMKIPNPMVDTDLERLLDDFVFMCLLVGNDFLPHLPSLEISEGAIDLLMTVYQKEFVQMGGYLTDSFKVNLKRVEHFLQALGVHESAIFRRRSQVQTEREKRFGKSIGPSQSLHLPRKRKSEAFWSFVDLIPDSTNPSSSTFGEKEYQSHINSTTPDGSNGIVDNFGAKKYQSHINSTTPDGSNGTVDKIKLGEEGWKERFYAEKFEARTEDERDKIRKHAVLKYIEGMCWVMHYYYEGVCSWQWFYPYHYAPFASDFYDLELYDIHFTCGTPFKPLDQLMAVLPAASAHALPSCYRKLMTDSTSPILEFYPNDFEIDMNGKRFEWQAICKLPFIKESQLLAEIAKVEHTLTDEERSRNRLGMDILFLHSSHRLAAKVNIFYERNKDHPKLAKTKVKQEIDPEFSGGMNGFIYISDKPVCQLEICSSIGTMEKIAMNKVISVFYKYPTFHAHIPRPPEGIIIPKTLVKKEDILRVPVLWHEASAVLGRVRSERPVPNSISGSCLAKLAHQLVSKYYAAKRKEYVYPAVQNGFLDTNDDSANQTNSKEIVNMKKMYNLSSVNETEPEIKESDTAVTRTIKKRKHNQRAAGLEQQAVKETSVPGHMPLNSPSCQTKQVSEEQVHEKNMSGASCPNVTDSDNKTPDTAVTKTSKKRKHNKRAAGLVKQAVGEGLGPGHMALIIPSCQTRQVSEEQDHDKKMCAASCLDMTDSDKKAPDTAVLIKQATEEASVPGHMVLNTATCQTLQVSEEQVHEEKMCAASFTDMTDSDKKAPDTAVTKTPKKRKRNRKAAVLTKQATGEASVPGHMVLNTATSQTLQVSEEQVHDKKIYDASGPNVPECEVKASDTAVSITSKKIEQPPVEATVPGNMAFNLPACQSHEKKMCAASCPDMTDSDKRAHDTAVTKTPKKRKRNRKAAVLTKQETGEASVPGHMVLNTATSQTLQVSEEQVHDKKIYDASGPNVPECEMKASDTAVSITLKKIEHPPGEATLPGNMAFNLPACQSHEKKMCAASCSDMTDSDKKAPDTAVTKTPKKRKRNRKAAVLTKQATGEASVPGHMVLNTAVCQTLQVSEELVHAKKIYDASCLNVPVCEMKASDTAVSIASNKIEQSPGEASVPGNMAFNLSACQSQEISEQVHENIECGDPKREPEIGPKMQFVTATFI